MATIPQLHWQALPLRGGGLWTGTISRASVPGGWLVVTRGFVGSPTGITFVPDSDHQWTGEEPSSETPRR